MQPINSLDRLTGGSLKSHKISYGANNRNHTSIKKSSKNSHLSSTLLIGTLAAIAVGGFAIAFKGKVPVVVEEKVAVSGGEYLTNIAKGLSEYSGKEITPDKLKSVMNIKEFKNALKSLKEENYIPSKENIEKGIFKADLHSHSNYSDGAGSVEGILNNVANYADKLNVKTNEKFIYALTDHDEIDGVKKALLMIAENPEKFENVRFVTGMEVSFAIPTQNKDVPSGIAELLVHCINPFSENINKFITSIKQKRLNMINAFIKDGRKLHPEVKFSFKEAKKANFFRYENMQNKQWGVFHYIETKRVIAQVAKEKGRNPEGLYLEIMQKVPERWDRHIGLLQQKGYVREGFYEDGRLKKLCIEKYSPQVSEGKVTYAYSENTIEDIVNTFSKEDDIFMSFAHPACIVENIKKHDGSYDYAGLEKFLSKLIDDSNGLIQGSEAYHQAYYPKYKKGSNIINSYLDEKNIMNLGGLDSHKKNWLTV